MVQISVNILLSLIMALFDCVVLACTICVVMIVVGLLAYCVAILEGHENKISKAIKKIFNVYISL